LQRRRKFDQAKACLVVFFAVRIRTASRCLISLTVSGIRLSWSLSPVVPPFRLRGLG
jgi:hypothetical protein